MKKAMIRHEAFEKFKDHMEALGYNLQFSETGAIEAVQKSLVSSLQKEAVGENNNG